MARRVFGGLVTGIALGVVAVAVASLARPDGPFGASAVSGGPRDLEPLADAPLSSGAERTVPPRGLPRLRSDTQPADPTRPRAE